jgi:dienelactone hydrolase
MKRLLFLPALFLAACASGPDKSQSATSTAPATNPYSLESKTIPVGVIPAAVLYDSQRNKDLEMSIEYPTREGPYPVVIFSPNYGSSRSDYVGLTAFWTSHGYVVIKPSHADSGALRETTPERVEEQPPQGRERRQRPSPQPQQPVAFRADPAEMWQTQRPDDWRNRVADITFIIDSLPKLIEQYPEIKDRVDATRIGVGGHSYGAFTALLIGGMKANNMSFADLRVKAIEAMSPPGPSRERGLTNDSWTNLRSPTLFLTGSRDFGASEAEDAAWRRQAYELSFGGDKWFVSIAGAGHAAFTGRFGEPLFATNPPLQPYPTSRPPVGGNYPQAQPPPSQRGVAQFSLGATTTVRTISLAFWDAYLKNDNAGREYLEKLKTRGDVQVASK